MAALIAVVRIGLFLVGAAWYSRSDWWQIPGYFALMTGLPDIYIVKGLRAQMLPWAITGSLTLAATSPVWAAGLVWLAKRPRRKPARSK